MVVPESYLETFSPDELQFLSSNDLISVIPRSAINSFNLVGVCAVIYIYLEVLLIWQRTVPQLRVLSRAEIPIWIAIILKEQGKCNLVPPPWLNREQLKERYEEEKQHKNRFSQLPWNWQEISRAFLRHAPDDLQDPAPELFYILQNIKEIRKLKAQRGLHELNESNVQLNGLSLMEINEIKPFVIKVMNELSTLHEASSIAQAQNESDEDSRSRDAYQ